MGDLGQFLDIGDVAERVADGFGIDGLGLVVDQLFERGRVAMVGKTHADAKLRQGVGKKVVCPAVERGRGNDVVARFGNRLDRVGDGSGAGSQGQRGDTPFQCGDAFLQHVLRRIHDACVDIAGHLEVEQIGAVLRAVEGVGGRLVNWDGDGLGGRIGAITAVDGEGFEFHGAGLRGLNRATLVILVGEMKYRFVMSICTAKISGAGFSR